MASHRTRSTVLLTQRKEALELLARIDDRAEPAERVTSLGELELRLPPSSIGVLIVDVDSVPTGLALVALARLNEEYPEIQKAVVFTEPPPLEFITYLVSCGAEILIERTDEESDGGDRLDAAVENLRQRARWSAC
ncbi:MAG: hypothetical protein JSU98_11500 [Gemmatimonadales bacterium]|nr:MAG: hypothetical protein JSU98_11500 [Gemmatimonadales bacterium]